MSDKVTTGLLKKMQELYEKGTPTKQIAIDLNLANTTVARYAKRYKFKRPGDFVFGFNYKGPKFKKATKQPPKIDLNRKDLSPRQKTFIVDCLRILELNESEGVGQTLYGSRSR